MSQIQIDSLRKPHQGLSLQKLLEGYIRCPSLQKLSARPAKSFSIGANMADPKPLPKPRSKLIPEHWNLLPSILGDVPVTEVTLEHVLNLKKDFLDRGAKPGYLNKVVMLVRSVIKHAAEKMHLPVMPWREIELPRKPRPEVRYLRQSELDRAMSFIHTDTLQGIRFKAVFTAMLDTGMRISEVLSLNRDSIEWGDKSAYIIGKGNKKRKVLFQDWSLWWIQQYLPNRKDKHEAMFVSHQSGYPIARLQTNDVQRVFRRIALKAGLEKFTPHTARKTAGSTMWNNGADIQDVQVFLGHEKLQTTQIYIGKNYDRVREAQSRTLQYRAVDVGVTAVIRWAKGYDKCGNCGKTDKPHGAKGYCINCYMNLKNARIRAEQSQTVEKPVPI